MTSKEELNIPEEFGKIIKDFISDIKNTFPEFIPFINKWWKDKTDFQSIENEEEREKKYLETEKANITFLFKYAQKKFPPRFFEILYQNEDMFKEDSELDTEFLPHIHFKNLWSFDITTKTRDTIWKYLQLILFSVVGSVNNKDAFGDTAKLFEAVNADDFKNKLEETLSQMQNLFENSNLNSNFGENEENNEGSSSGLNFNMEDMPNANDIHNHIYGMLDGKLGKLAKEIAEETASELNMDMENVTNMQDVFSKLIKNPTKMMGLVKNVGDKLDTKIKSGEIKESELISEAADIVNKMKNMPGMENIQSMLSKMGIPGLGKGAKINTAAMEAQLNRNMKNAQLKERLRAKADANKLAKEQQQQQNLYNKTTQQTQQNNINSLSEKELISLFENGNNQPQPQSQSKKEKSTKNSNKSGKKKK